MNSVIKSRRYLAVLVAVVAAVAVLLLWPKPQRYITDQGVVWTTEYHITYRAAKPLNDSITAVLQRVDTVASVYNKQSRVSAFNAGHDIVMDDILERLVRASLVVNEQSGGAFDPTVMPLVNAWGFGYKTGQMPTQHVIDSLRQFVGMKLLAIEGNHLVKRDDRTQLDFSSIAKGLAVDEVAAMLRRNGVTDYMVEIGGEVYCAGVNAQGKPWHVSVDMPGDDPDSHEAALVLEVDTLGIATSGNYRKFKQDGNRRISHIVNPATGSSEVSNLLSVTIVAHDCMTADAWATACMVMGTDATQRMMEQRTDLGVMTISADSLGRYVVWSNAPFANLIPEK